MPNYCTNCGNALKHDWNVCPYCGKEIRFLSTKLVSNPIYSTSTPNNGNELEEKQCLIQKKSKKFTKKRVKIIVFVSIIILGGVLTPLIIFFSSFRINTITYYVNNGSYSKSYTCMIPTSTYNYYVDQAHPPHNLYDWSYAASIMESYCTPDEPELVKIAQEVKSQCLNPNDDEEVINSLLSFSQGIGYKSDFQDIAQYPLETLINQGDCEDLSIFFGSLVESLGYEAILICVLVYDETQGQWFGHACVGVYLDFVPNEHEDYPPSYNFEVSGEEYWLCETTYQGWMVGQLATSDISYFSIQAYSYIT